MIRIWGTTYSHRPEKNGPFMWRVEFEHNGRNEFMIVAGADTWDARKAAARELGISWL